MLSEPVILALIAAVVAAIGSIASMVASIMNGRASRQRGEDVKEDTRTTHRMVNAVDSKTDALRQTAFEIHDLANGNLSRVNNERDAANAKVAELEKLLAELGNRRRSDHT